VSRVSRTLLVVASLGTMAAPRLAAAACKDANVPVGADCRKYGDSWGDSAGFLPHFPIVAWVSARTLSYPTSSGGMFDGNVESSPLAYHFRGNALGSSAIRSYGGETGLAWLVVPYFYVGANLAYGAGHSSASPFVANGLTLSPGAGLNVDDTVVSGVVGMRLPLGPISVRADLLAGASLMSVDQYATSGANQLTATGSATGLYLEPRVHVDVWVTPFFSVGAFAGMPSLDPTGTNAGITLSVHTVAYDGRSSLF
jgi:hypothetical protein